MIVSARPLSATIVEPAGAGASWSPRGVGSGAGVGSEAGSGVAVGSCVGADVAIAVGSCVGAGVSVGLEAAVGATAILGGRFPDSISQATASAMSASEHVSHAMRCITGGGG